MIKNKFSEIHKLSAVSNDDPIRPKLLVVYQADLRTIVNDPKALALGEDYSDVALFSPPYKEKDGYSDGLMINTGELVGRWLKPGSWCFFNFAQLKEDFGRPYEAFSEFLRGSCGALKRHQALIWIKSFSPGPGQVCVGHSQPLNSTSLLYYSWEYIFTCYKPSVPGGGPPAFDRLAVGVPFADKSNLTRGGRGKNGDVRCAGDVWVEPGDAVMPDGAACHAEAEEFGPPILLYVPYETTGATKKKSHDYEWPAGLVRRLLKLAGAQSGWNVLDPFLGGGQTAVVAREFGCSAVGIEREPERALRAIARWEGRE